VILLALNASPGEKKIKHEIPTLYGVEDPQFLRSMGS
jgi:cardiolipin synthase